MGHRYGRHKRIKLENLRDLPQWVLNEVETDEETCLCGVATEAYEAKALAEWWGALNYPKCEEPYAAGMKALAQLNDPKVSEHKRSLAGARAMRKFWEAKVAAKRESSKR